MTAAPLACREKIVESPFAGVPIPAILEAFPGFPHLNAMLRRAGVERTAVSSGEMRELRWTCLFCASHAECTRWLRSDPPEALPGFCDNAGKLRRVRSRL
jgi:hypothetical protein